MHHQNEQFRHFNNRDRRNRINSSSVRPSLLSAENPKSALSRNGKRVLHVDEKMGYGGLEPTYNLRNLFKWILDDKIDVTLGPLHPSMNTTVLPEQGEVPMEIQELISNVVACATLPKRHAPLSYFHTQLAKLMVNGRNFNIDLYPKLIYSRGDLVQLLISSSVGKYLEFKSLSNLRVRTKGRMQEIPCSKEDVFTSDSIGLADKRRLMKALSMSKDVLVDPFSAHLDSLGLTDTLQDVVGNGIAATTFVGNGKNVPSVEALKRVDRFMASVGIYGKSPLLLPMHGISEASQAFCRYAAVFGATYILGTKPDLHFSEQGVEIDVIGEKMFAKDVVVGQEVAVELGLATVDSVTTLHWCMTLLSTKLSPALTILCDTGKVIVLQLGADTVTCPDGMTVVWFATLSPLDSPRQALQVIADEYLESMGVSSNVEMMMFYDQRVPSVSSHEPKARIAQRNSDLDIENCVTTARNVVFDILGEELDDWLLPPPNE